MTEEQILKDFLEFKLKTLGKVRLFHPTDEAVQSEIDKFNKKYAQDNKTN